MAIQTCNKCRKKIEGDFRMELMNGPKGYRRYAVHVNCAGVPAGRDGGRQIAKRKAKEAQMDAGVDPVCSLGYDTNQG